LEKLETIKTTPIDDKGNEHNNVFLKLIVVVVIANHEAQRD
jgi:hypothetical protein